MESTPRLYDTLVDVLSQHANWVDRRHLKTLAWIMVGLIQASMVSLTAWAPYVHSRAVYAQSLVRLFDRWLQNKRIEVHQLYGPLIQHALPTRAQTRSIWRSTPRPGGRRIVSCAFHASIGDERCRSCGRCFTIRAIVSPMPPTLIYWTR
jgi:hypothetical protein